LGRHCAEGVSLVADDGGEAVEGVEGWGVCCDRVFGEDACEGGEVLQRDG